MIPSNAPLFVFDLDSTITKCELLPLLARETGMEEEIARQTEHAMRSGTSFEADFPRRVALLKDIPLPRAREIAAGAPVHEAIAAFLRANAPRCLIMTGNLDVWIGGLVERLGMQGRCLCSRAKVENGRLLGVEEVFSKTRAAQTLNRPFVAIGDGTNDIGMLQAAGFGVAFSGTRRAAPAVRRAANACADTAEELCRMLEPFL